MALKALLRAAYHTEWRISLMTKTCDKLNGETIETFRAMTHLAGSIGSVFTVISICLGCALWYYDPLTFWTIFWMLFLNTFMWALIAYTEFWTFFHLPCPGKAMRISQCLKVFRNHTVGVALDAVLIILYIYQFATVPVLSLKSKILNPEEEMELAAADGDIDRYSDGSIPPSAPIYSDDDLMVITFGLFSFLALVLMCVTEWMCAVCYFQATNTKYHVAPRIRRAELDYGE